MSLLVYTLITVIILRYSDIRDSTGTVIYALYNNVGLRLGRADVDSWRNAQAPCARRLYSLLGNAAQHTHSTLVLVTAISMHALLDLHTKLARSAARTAS